LAAQGVVERIRIGSKRRIEGVEHRSGHITIMTHDGAASVIEASDRDQ
jgi:hypothetical protein